MAQHVLRREHWNGQPFDLGEGFRLRKGPHEAVCRLWTHELGWELVLDVGALHRSQVCRSSEEILGLTESWKAALLKRGCTLP